MNIWVAAADDQRSIVEQHIASGVSPNAKDPNGYTPMHAAVSYGHIGLLKYLVSQGGDINIGDNEGDTPLHHAEDAEVARFVVETLNADYKIKNNDGQTAAEYIAEEDEFPQVAAYLRSLAHDKPQGDFLASLPAPGTIDGHEIRYSMEKPEGEVDEEELKERRKKIEAILDGDNPEEALRDLVRDAVKEGLGAEKSVKRRR